MSETDLPLPPQPDDLPKKGTRARTRWAGVAGEVKPEKQGKRKRRSRKPDMTIVHLRLPDKMVEACERLAEHYECDKSAIFRRFFADGLRRYDIPELELVKFVGLRGDHPFEDLPPSNAQLFDEALEEGQRKWNDRYGGGTVAQAGGTAGVFHGEHSYEAAPLPSNIVASPRGHA